jgi:endonuclease/exonuclease/phosphatase family metal-dependent hydrolase
MRTATLSLAAGLLVGVLAACGGGRAAPPADLPAVEPLRVVTLNLWHDQRDWPRRMEYIVRELRRLDPDVIALQEVLQHETLPNQAAALGAALGYEVHFTSVDPPERARRYGNAILTRHPVLARGQKVIEPANDYRTVAHVRIRFGGREVDVYNTHLHHTGEGGAIRRVQLEEMLRFIGETGGGGPVVVAGDFNAPVEYPEMRLLDERFGDAFGTLHSGSDARGVTTLNPAIGHQPRRIDHVFFERGAWEPVHTEIILDRPDADGTWASDHFGVYARLRPTAADGR